MKKILTLCFVMAIARPAFAQETLNPFLDPLFELTMAFKNCFVETPVTARNDPKKNKITHKYEITRAAIVIYEHTVFGTSAVDATYADKWFYIPLKDLYLNTKETNIDVFIESTEITLTNKLKRIIAGNGTKYNLADENTYLQTGITFPFILNGKDFKNTIEYLNSALVGLRNEGKDNAVKETVATEKEADRKAETIKSTIKKEYYKSGELQSEVTYVNDMKQGTGKFYYTSGELRAVVSYVNGKEEGKGKIYYKTGELQYETAYVNDKKEGTEKEYFVSGKLKSTMIFKNGKANGLIQRFHENGNLQSTAEAIDGYYNGYVTDYNEKGTVTEKKYWVLGTLSGTLNSCDGVIFLIDKLKDKKYEQLNNRSWMKENYEGIKNFEYDYFSEGSHSGAEVTAFMNKPNLCVLTYLPEFKDNNQMYAAYRQLVDELSRCKDIGDKEEPAQSGGKMAIFKYDKKTFITVIASEYNTKLSLRVSRQAEKK